jgi:hypothetical protein
LSGITEGPHSTERFIANSIYVKAQKEKKYNPGILDRFGFDVKRSRTDKIIDMTNENYQLIWDTIDQINEKRVHKKDSSMLEIKTQMLDRNIGGRTVEPSSPLSQQEYI